MAPYTTGAENAKIAIKETGHISVLSGTFATKKALIERTAPTAVKSSFGRRIDYTHSSMTFRQLLKVSRPRFWIYLVGPYVVGLAAAGTIPDLALIILGLYVTLPANLLIYGVNDLYDRETDKLNVKKDGYEARLQDNSVASLKLIIAVTNVPFLVALLLLLPATALPWLLLFLITGVGYSAPPIRAKTKPFFDAMFNILYAAPGFAAYAAAGHTPAWPLVLASLAWCMAMHAYSAVPDIAADRASHTPTIATTLGATKTLLFCAFCYGVAGLASWHFIGWFALAGATVYLALMAASLRYRLQPDSLFKLYKSFPYVNTILGAGLFFVALAH